MTLLTLNFSSKGLVLEMFKANQEYFKKFSLFQQDIAFSKPYFFKKNNTTLYILYLRKSSHMTYKSSVT